MNEADIFANWPAEPSALQKLTWQAQGNPLVTLCFVLGIAALVGLWAWALGRRWWVWALISSICTPAVGIIFMLVFTIIKVSKKTSSTAKSIKTSLNRVKPVYVVEQLRKIEDLRQTQLYTDIEFQSRKKEVLDEMRTKGVVGTTEEVMVTLAPLIKEGILNPTELDFLKHPAAAGAPDMAGESFKMNCPHCNTLIVFKKLTEGEKTCPRCREQFELTLDDE